MNAYLVYSGNAQDDFQPKCLYLTGFAALLAYDDIKDLNKRQSDQQKKTANKLRDDFVPTWAEFNGNGLKGDVIAGNQNTLRQ